MALADILIVVALLLLTAMGAYWGLLRQLIALLGLVAGIAVAGRYGPAAADALSSFVADEATAQLAGTLLLLAAVSATSSFLASLLWLRVGLLFLGPADRLLGALLGALQAALLAAALLVAAALPDAPWPDLLQGAWLAPALVRGLGPLVAALGL